jgi:hypothetical protein
MVLAKFLESGMLEAGELVARQLAFFLFGDFERIHWL